MLHAINTEDAPQPIGTYSQAIRCENMVFLSGQIPLTPDGVLIDVAWLADQNLMALSDINPELTLFNEQVRQIFRNIQAVAVAAEGDLQRIVKLTVYLTDLNNFSHFNLIMEEFFVEPYPARAVVQVSKLPRNVPVEVDAIMMLRE